MLNLSIELYKKQLLSETPRKKKKKSNYRATQGRTDGVVVVVVVGYLSHGQSLGGAIEVYNNHVFPVNNDR